MLIKQLIELEKVKTENLNLNLRKHLQNLVMDGWSVTPDC